MTSVFSPAIWMHVASAVAALVLGAFVLTGRKGTSRHRSLALAYIVAMAVTVLSAALAPATVIRFGNTRFGFFHVFVAIGAISLTLACTALLRWRRTRAVEALRAHQTHFAYSYAGLLMAGVSQLAVNPLFSPVRMTTPAAYWGTFLALNLVIYGAAIWLIEGRLRRGDPLRFSARPQMQNGARDNSQAPFDT